MDDETRQAFAKMLGLISHQNEQFDQRFNDIVTRMNNQHERLIDRINQLSHDFINVKSFLITDSLIMGNRIKNRIKSIEDRLDDIEKRI